MKTEHEEQRDFVRWWRQNRSQMIFAIPNGGHRNPATAGRLKAEGVLPGVPDLFVPALFLWVEMKREKRGALSAAQRSMIEKLSEAGYTVIVAHGCDDAIRQTSEFLMQS